MIRPANFGDIPRLHDLMKEFHEASVYADTVRFDGAECKRILVNSIKHHAGKRAGGAAVFVAERDGEIEGLIVGLLDRVYHIGVELMATDLFFAGSERVSPRDMLALYDAFLAWAEENDRVVEIVNGATAILGGWEGAEALYRKRGLERFGVIYRKGMPCRA